MSGIGTLENEAITPVTMAAHVAAMAEGAVDLIAADLAELLAQLDGREVQLASGPRTLRTATAAIEE